MVYKILIRKEADKALLKMPANWRIRVTEKILQLARNPDDASLDIKSLQGSELLRMRVGRWRVIFVRDDDVKIIAIEKIKPRGGAYK